MDIGPEDRIAIQEADALCRLEFFVLTRVVFESGGDGPTRNRQACMTPRNTTGNKLTTTRGHLDPDQPPPGLG